MPELQRCQCGASWIGERWQRCNYCEIRIQRKLQEYRKQLLAPDWLQEDGPKYWELDEDLRQVWNLTRGIDRHKHIVKEWVGELFVAAMEEDSVITLEDALGALGLWQKMTLTQLKNSSTYGKPESNNYQT